MSGCAMRLESVVEVLLIGVDLGVHFHFDKGRSLPGHLTHLQFRMAWACRCGTLHCVIIGQVPMGCQARAAWAKGLGNLPSPADPERRLDAVGHAAPEGGAATPCCRLRRLVALRAVRRDR